jgi:hypothetical protein
MKKQKKSILVLAIVLFTILFFFRLNVLGGEGFAPPPPDKNKTLPANDGEPDGCSSSRFKCVMGGEAVLDKQTGLTWARNVNIANVAKPWQEAVKFCQNLEIGNQKGWRLPTKEELITVLDTSQGGPALPDGHPFKAKKDVGSGSKWRAVWTGTTYEGNSNSAYYVSIHRGRVEDELKLFDFRIWPVLGGK